MTKLKAKKYRVQIDGTYYPYDDAKQDVSIHRDLVDLWSGVPGDAGKCMNHHCIIRNAKAFPHPVLAAAVIKSRVYIFDRPDHVVRYILGGVDQKLIGKHDTLKIGESGELVLRAPVGSMASGRKKNLKSPPTGKTTGERRVSLGKGEKARIAAAVGALE